MMVHMRRELEGQEPQITPQIDNLFILDRTVDMLTPMLTQLTYEGLIDEIFGINNSKLIHVNEKVLRDAINQGRSDALFISWSK